MRILLPATRKAGEFLDLKKVNDSWALWAGETLITPVTLDKETASPAPGRLPLTRRLGLDHYKCVVTADGKEALVVTYTDLHRHSDNSLKDGMIKVPTMVKRTEYAGAITDHGVMYGFLEFYKGMKAAGKHPIIGFEAYVEDDDGKLGGNHLVLLAKNNAGYKNLLKLTSESYDHFYRKPHVTWKMLKKYSEGVICTSACLGGVIPQAILACNMALAEKVALKYKSIFGEDFYIEIQRHGTKDEQVVNPDLIKLAHALNIPLVATTDAHYPNKDDAEAHEVLLCLQTKKTLMEPHMTFEGTGYHLHTSEEMDELFKDLPEALDNTILLGEKCHVDVPLGEVNLPDYTLPEGFKTQLDYFKHLCNEGFQKRFKGKPQLTDPVYLERLQYEMGVIEQMGFESYFIIVQDFIDYARRNNVYIGPGRGSAAGSLAAFCMGITDMDPIRFNLLFERFLNPERISWPDIDTDIEHVGRQKVIDYMTRKYGADNVCRIVTFGTMAAKMVLKDVARVMGYQPSWANALAKLIPNEVGMTLDKALTANPELKQRYETEADVAKVMNIAKSLEGCKRHASQHACGLVCAPSSVSDYLPVSLEADDNGEKSLTSQVVMTEVEELSLLKMDLLGLKNLTAIHEVITAIKKTRGVYTTYQQLPLDDRASYKMLASGITGGVFQLESPGMTSMIKQMFEDIDILPDERMDECFERLIAAVALYRPGPMDYIPQYLESMKDPSKIHYDCPQLEHILSSTYGIFVYQEQVQQACRDLAGYSLGRADLVRRAMGKKKQSVMDAEREIFIYGNAATKKPDEALVPGCIANGIEEAVAEVIWNKMAEFAKYAFNRSHAACYAWIASITAYMACHWPTEFYCGMLNAFEEIGDKVKEYLNQAAKRGIKILPPDINKSTDKCTVEGDCIRIGFRTLSGLNKYSKQLVKERRANGDFADCQDLFDRMDRAGERPNKTVIESLVFSGSLDSFGLNRQQMRQLFDMLEVCHKKEEKDRALDQISFFTAAEMAIQAPDVPELSDRILMENEYKAIGFYLTRHPADEMLSIVANDSEVESLTTLVSRGEPVYHATTVGLIRNLKQRFTRMGDLMYTFTIEDRYTTLNCVIFPKRVPANKHRLVDGAVVKICGDLQMDEDRGAQLIVYDVTGRDEMPQLRKQILTVSIRNKAEQDALLKFVEAHPGNTEIQLLAHGKLYPIKKKISMSLDTLSYLSSNFNVQNATKAS